ncbi:MAG: hypothetical protein JST44_23295 [Cyanobacteria bacterium SZAS LIN-5]|nr:hypothetical protein [Cyanobacteria bacterium SZAS LIN-5]
MHETSSEKTTNSNLVAPSLKALLENFIDYAGIFPPAKLSFDTALDNYKTYRNGEYSWMLHWLVLGTDQAKNSPPSLNSLIAMVGETDDERVASLETKSIVVAQKPVYCEILPGNNEQLDAAKAANCFAKIRTGGLTPEAIPSTADVARFITDCAERKLAFKATAGLHHPIRAMHPLTYESNAPQAVMHGFINVLMASCFAWHGERDIEPIIAETDAANFSFTETAKWREKVLSVAQIRDARKNFIHSVGSCSFDEPIEDLRTLKLLP